MAASILLPRSLPAPGPARWSKGPAGCSAAAAATSAATATTAAAHHRLQSGRKGVPARCRPLPAPGWRVWVQVLPLTLLLAGAFCWAPEAPEDQAAICQRHNGEVACRVW